MLNIRHFFNGLQIVPRVDGATAGTAQGDLAVSSVDGNLYYNNGSGDSPIATATNTLVLTNKSISYYASATITVGIDTITFTAVNPGPIGNSISLVFNGSSTVATVVAAWNSANPSNTVGFTGPGSDTPTAQTVNLGGGNVISGLTNDNLSGSAGITNNNLAVMPSFTVKANDTASPATPQDIALGTVTEATSAVLVLTGWADATLGAPTIQVLQATTSQSGYLSSTDWNTFNNKEPALTFPDSVINTSGVVTLQGDVPFGTIPVNYYYGTNLGGIVGYHPAFTMTTVPAVFGSRASPELITASVGLTDTVPNMDKYVQEQIIYVAGNGAPTVITASPPIEAGDYPGQRMQIIGSSLTNTVIIHNSPGQVELNGTVVLGLDDAISLDFDGTAWVETSRS
jgi:hypothetical protein